MAWSTDKLEIALEDCINGILGDFVKEAAAYAQAHARVDTGFYRDYIVGVPPNSPGLKSDAATMLNGSLSLREYIAEAFPPTQSEKAALVAQATYSIFVEIWDDTLYNAVIQTIPSLQGIANRHAI
jgi:hypothetical protein